MSPPIYTPDGSEVSEIVLPDGSTASEVIGPDGSVVFEAGPDIPDSVVNNLDIWFGMTEGSGTTTTADVGSLTATIHGGGWQSGVGYQDAVTTYDGIDDNLFADNSRTLNESFYAVCGWVSISSFDDFGGLFSAVESDNRTANPISNGWRVDMGTGSPRLIHANTGTTNPTTTATQDITDGSWYFVAARGDGDQGNLYIWDTTQQLSSGGGSVNRATSGDRWIRAMGGDEGRFVGGQLDAVGLSTGSNVTESDFAAIWNDTKGLYL